LGDAPLVGEGLQRAGVALQLHGRLAGRAGVVLLVVAVVPAQIERRLEQRLDRGLVTCHRCGSFTVV
jgi:hypothetical protein